jgi:enoyl-CoA hydratase/carnithine racemase
MITTNIEAGVATVVVGDFRRLSSFDPQAGRALTDCLRGLADDDTVKAIVLASATDDFCAPLQAAPARQAPAEVQAVYASASGLYQTLCYFPKLVIAAVRGRCAEAGSAILLCTGMAVAAKDCAIVSPFDTIPQASYVLATLTMRMARAKAWLLTGAAMDGLEASEFGLVNRAVDSADVMLEARRLARQAARMPMDGIRISKVMLETYLDSQGVGKEFDHATFYAGMAEAASGSGGSCR